MADKRVGVKSYKRHTKSGELVDVESYSQMRDAAQELLKAQPGRPLVSAKSGAFPGGRSVPKQQKFIADKGGVEAARAEGQASGSEESFATELETHVASQEQSYAVEKARDRLRKKGYTVDERSHEEKQDEETVKSGKERVKAPEPAVRRAKEFETEKSDRAKQNDLSSNSLGLKPKTEKQKEPRSIDVSALDMTNEEYDAHVKTVQAILRDPETRKHDTQEMHGERDENGDLIEGMFKPERARMHEEIIADLLAENENVPRDHKAVMSGGLGGAGKGYVLENFAGINEHDYVTVDPDRMKSILIERGMAPSVDGLSPMEGASLIHEESSHLAGLLTQAAMSRGMNVIIDGTMANANSARRKSDKLKAAGYEVEGVFVDVPVDVSIKSALQRHRGGVDRFRRGDGQGGRYVPVEYLEASRTEEGNEFLSKNAEAYAGLMDDGTFSRARIFDNSNREPGAVPKLVRDVGRKPDVPSDAEDEGSGKASTPKKAEKPAQDVKKAPAPKTGGNAATRSDDKRLSGGQTATNFQNETTGAPMGKTETGDTFEQLFAAKGVSLIEERYGKVELVTGAGAGTSRTTPLDLRTRTHGGELKTMSTKSNNLKTAIKKDEIDRKLHAVSTEKLKPLLLVQVVDQKTRKVNLYGMEMFGSKAVSKMEHFGEFAYTLNDFKKAQEKSGHATKSVDRAISLLTPAQKAKYDKFVAQGMSKTEALAAVRKGSGSEAVYLSMTPFQIDLLELTRTWAS